MHGGQVEGVYSGEFDYLFKELLALICSVVWWLNWVATTNH